MMLETIEDLLDWSKYGIIEEKGYIEIYNYINNTKMVDQEMFVKLGFVDNLYSIYQVSRGIERLVFECEDRIYFLAYVYFYVDKLYSDKSYIRNPRSKIFLLLLDNKVEEAEKLLKNNLNSKYAVINKIENGKISLVERKADSAIIYNGKIIEENIEFTEGFRILLIRSKYLERFNLMFNRLKKSLPVDKYYDELLDYYVFNIEINCSTSSD
ncbi:MAG TPA: hypothetical protein VK071_05170 [Tissierellales bacterium]|nr:hypothetical protein [Tissierellales bacterium]